MKRKYSLFPFRSQNIPLLLVLFFLIISSCGVPTIILFNAAEVITDAGAKTITIVHNSSNDALPSVKFIGYEVYYKLYKSSDIDKRAEDKNYITDTSARVPSTSVLTSKNFLKLKVVNFSADENKFNDTTDTPNVAINSSNQRVILDFGVSNPSEYSYTAGTTGEFYGYQALLINQNNSTEVLHRNLNTTTKPFFDTQTNTSFSSSDYDVRKMISSFNNDTLELVIAVIPYGINLANVQVVYGNIAISEDVTLDYGSTP